MQNASTQRKPQPPPDRAPTLYWNAKWRQALRASLLMVATLQLALCAPASESSKATGRLEGTVFVENEGHRSCPTGTKVVAGGPVTVETVTNEEGRYVFVALPPGTYTLEAISSGLDAIETVTLTPDRTVQVPLQLKPSQINTSVTVTADSTDGKSSAPTETIGEKTVRDAPNLDERFETLLPLVPGVVRGPDGHINLKGASSTQNGALVNSANVTDPATGSPAINLPIDVVSSVHVMSNPYDPQYGRFTGAVSSVETKTGSFEGRHFSIQNVLPRWRDRDGHIVGLGAATPRTTFTGPLIKNRVAFTQSFRVPLRAHPGEQPSSAAKGHDTGRL